MREKICGSVMECADFMVLLCLLTACCTTLVFAQKRQDLNGPCIHVSECKRLAYFCSRNKTCQCAPGYLPNEQWTKCIGYVGSRCIYDSQCIEGAYCTGAENREMCRCREQDDFYPSEDLQSCISEASILHPNQSTTLAVLAVFWTSLYFNT